MDAAELIKKYSPSEFLNNAINNFDSENTREWLTSLRIPTFIGSGRKVLADKTIKPAEVLKVIKDYLQTYNVQIVTGAKFIRFENNSIIIEQNGNEKLITSDYYIFGLGGASWSKTGSDGSWTKIFNSIEVKTLPFQPSNCGVNIEWEQSFKKNHSGKPLKNVSVSCDKLEHYGELSITDYGLEGNAVYPIIPEIREMLGKEKTANIKLDLKPDNNLEQLFEKIFNINSPKEYAKALNLNRTQIALLKSFTEKYEYLNTELLIQKIKSLEIPIISLRPIDEAISTVGGIDVNELNENFSLKEYPNIFTIGEMVNWDAPTGGFLLQGCFSMGSYVAKSILA